MTTSRPREPDHRADPVGQLRRLALAAIAANLVNLAHALGRRAVAEGIETPGQLAHLRELGCDLGRGYLLGRPVPAAVIDALLAAARTPAPA